MFIFYLLGLNSYINLWQMLHVSEARVMTFLCLSCYRLPLTYSRTLRSNTPIPHQASHIYIKVTFKWIPHFPQAEIKLCRTGGWCVSAPTRLHFFTYSAIKLCPWRQHVEPARLAIWYILKHEKSAIFCGWILCLIYNYWRIKEGISILILILTLIEVFKFSHTNLPNLF